MPWSDLADVVGYDTPDHHRAREDIGEQEKLEESSMDVSEEAVTARWRPQARLGGVQLAVAQLMAQAVAQGKGKAR